MPSPVYTIENECHDCYKCVRHCPVKAIRVADGKAAVMPEACVSCGACVKVCPARAKRIRNDLPRLKSLLASGQKVYASVAPSFAGYFRGATIGQVATALKRLGFAGVSETAHGAEAASAATAEFLAKTQNRVTISSACPAAVDMIRRYLPQWADAIEPVPSPVRAHCRLLKDRFGEDAKVVFLGPCAAKKNESDAHPDELELAVIFPAIWSLLEERGIYPAEQEESPLELGEASEGRFYAVEGGMNDTLRDGSDGVRYVSVSGLGSLKRMLEGAAPGAVAGGGRKIFVEALACSGGCINGPAMSRGGSGIATILATDGISPLQPSAARGVAPCASAEYKADPVAEETFSEEAMRVALARTGKFSKSDELDCGACGYPDCRAFARALIEGKAEEAMCHTYLKRNFRRTSNALIKYIPAAVVIVDKDLCVTECNRHFAEMSDSVEVFDALGNLSSAHLGKLMPAIEDLMAAAVEHGSEVALACRKVGERIVNVSVFPIALGSLAGAVVQDVTKNEFQREKIAQKARDVIERNVKTVQEVARLFGEHIAESEILLNEIAGVYHSKTQAQSHVAADVEEEYLNG